MELAEVVASLDDRRESRDSARKALPTGSLGLDLALGGGYGAGKIVELSGDYSTYKTFFALHTVAQAQRFGQVLWLDSASDFNPEHARLAGVRSDRLVVARPKDAGEAMYSMRICAGDFALMVCDSASGLSWDEEQYSTMAGWFQWLKADIQPHTTALFISNERATSDQAFTRELRKWSSQQVRLFPAGTKQISAMVVKNHIVQPHTHHIRLRFLPDFDAEFELVQLGHEVGVIEDSNSNWLYFDGIQLGHGIEQAVRFLNGDPNVAHYVAEAIKDALR